MRFFVAVCQLRRLNLFIYYLFIYFMNIYIGNLNYSVRENDLKEVMEDYGTVLSVKIIKDRETGRSKGFAFCEIEEEEGAKKAIAELNGSDYAGRPMVVKEALPKN
jgi:RNA recognition motif-containing protein